jgi:hypothetical protein
MFDSSANSNTSVPKSDENSETVGSSGNRVTPTKVVTLTYDLKP